jgi:hypothetical protein
MYAIADRLPAAVSPPGQGRATGDFRTDAQQVVRTLQRGESRQRFDAITTPQATLQQPEPHNLAATVFVYRHKQTGQIVVTYRDRAEAYSQHHEYALEASLEPRRWIEAHFAAASGCIQSLGPENAN